MSGQAKLNLRVIPLIKGVNMSVPSKAIKIKLDNPTLGRNSHPQGTKLCI